MLRRPRRGRPLSRRSSGARAAVRARRSARCGRAAGAPAAPARGPCADAVRVRPAPRAPGSALPRRGAGSPILGRSARSPDHALAPERHRRVIAAKRRWRFFRLGRPAPIAHAAPIYTRALLVFSGRTGVAWLRWLRTGFRHCFVAVDDGVEWLTIDPLLHRLEVRASGLPSDFDLAGEYRRMGLTVAEVIPAPVPLRRAPLGLFTCVETAKRLLGIRAPWVFTPWQLYRLASRAIPSGAQTPGAAGARQWCCPPTGRTRT